MPRHQITKTPKACPGCGELGELTGSMWTTLVAYSGPHDGNCLTGIFECPNGHRFRATTHYQCSCGWSGVKACNIAGHDKVELIANTKEQGGQTDGG